MGDSRRTTISEEPPGDVRVRVLLQADMRKYLPRGENGPRVLTLPVGSTMAHLLEALGIPQNEIVTIGLNGELAARDTVVPDNAEITMFSPMEGG
jgi:sulfur carrier protein ThiS